MERFKKLAPNNAGQANKNIRRTSEPNSSSADLSKGHENSLPSLLDEVNPIKRQHVPVDNGIGSPVKKRKLNHSSHIGLGLCKGKGEEGATLIDHCQRFRSFHRLNQTNDKPTQRNMQPLPFRKKKGAPRQYIQENNLNPFQLNDDAKCGSQCGAADKNCRKQCPAKERKRKKPAENFEEKTPSQCQNEVACISEYGPPAEKKRLECSLRFVGDKFLGQSIGNDVRAETNGQLCSSPMLSKRVDNEEVQIKIPVKKINNEQNTFGQNLQTEKRHPSQENSDGETVGEATFKNKVRTTLDCEADEEEIVRRLGILPWSVQRDILRQMSIRNLDKIRETSKSLWLIAKKILHAYLKDNADCPYESAAFDVIHIAIECYRNFEPYDNFYWDYLTLFCRDSSNHLPSKFLQILSNFPYLCHEYNLENHLHPTKLMFVMSLLRVILNLTDPGNIMINEDENAGKLFIEATLIGCGISLLCRNPPSGHMHFYFMNMLLRLLTFKKAGEKNRSAIYSVDGHIYCVQHKSPSFMWDPRSIVLITIKCGQQLRDLCRTAITCLEMEWPDTCPLEQLDTIFNLKCECSKFHSAHGEKIDFSPYEDW